MSKNRKEAKKQISNFILKRNLDLNQEIGNTLSTTKIFSKDSRNRLNNKRFKFKAQAPILNKTRKNFNVIKNLIESDVEK